MLSEAMRLCIWHPPPSSLEGSFGVVRVAGGVTRRGRWQPNWGCPLRIIEGRISSPSILPEVKVKEVDMLHLNQMPELSVPLSADPRRLPTYLPNAQSRRGDDASWDSRRTCHPISRSGRFRAYRLRIVADSPRIPAGSSQGTGGAWRRAMTATPDDPLGTI
jgi:hypothetical protein